MTSNTLAPSRFIVLREVTVKVSDEAEELPRPVY